MIDPNTLRPPAWHRVATQTIVAGRGYGAWQWLIDADAQEAVFRMRDAGKLAMVHRRILGGFELLIGAVPDVHKRWFGAFSHDLRNDINMRRMVA